MKKLRRAFICLATSFVLLSGCGKPSASDVAGVYTTTTQQEHGMPHELRLRTSGSYEDVSFQFDGKAVNAKTNLVGTWTFNPTQSFVILDGASAYFFDGQSTQASLVRTSTPAMPSPTTTMQIGTNSVAVAEPVFYRASLK